MSTQFFAVLLITILIVGYFFARFSLVAVNKHRIEIDSQAIREIGVFRVHELLLDEIEGFRIVTTQYVNYLMLIPKNSHLRKMRVALIVEHRDRLLEWAHHNLTDLDRVGYKMEMNEILSNDALGFSPEAKMMRMAQARKWCRRLNLGSLVMCLWGMIWPQPYQLVMWILLFLPVTGLILLHHCEGLVKLDGKAKSAYPNVAQVFLMPGLVLALRAMLDWHILEWHNFWNPFTVFTLGLLGLLFTMAYEMRKKIASAILFALFCAVYGYGATIVLNGILATAQPVSYQAQVMQKRISTGKHTDYYFTLSAWGPRNKDTEVTVSKAVYGRHPEGGTVTVFVRDGRFGIPFYFVR